MKQWRAMITLAAMLLALSGTTATAAAYQAPKAEVQAVGQVLRTLELALNSANVDAVIAHYTDDAKIESLVAGGVVDKATFREALIQAHTPLVTYGTPNIDFADPTYATIRVNVYLFGRPYRIQYQVVQRDARWLIYDQKYLWGVPPGPGPTS